MNIIIFNIEGDLIPRFQMKQLPHRLRDIRLILLSKFASCCLHMRLQSINNASITHYLEDVIAKLSSFAKETG